MVFCLKINYKIFSIKMYMHCIKLILVLFGSFILYWNNFLTASMWSISNCVYVCGIVKSSCFLLSIVSNCNYDEVNAHWGLKFGVSKSNGGICMVFYWNFLNVSGCYSKWIFFQILIICRSFLIVHSIFFFAFAGDS